jgi:tetratricopeptide (TPR) repeat protein
MNRNGEHKKGIEISQELLKEAQQLNNPVLIIDATISLVEAMRRMGMLNESLELIQKAEQHIGAVTSLNTRDILERKAILKNFKGIIYWTTGLLSESLENFQNSLTIREELGDERDIAVCLNNIGNIHTYKGELDLALDVYKQALTIREKLGNIRDIGSSIGNIALLYQYKADFDKSLHYWMQGKKIFEQIGNTFFLANTLYYIINLYMEHDKVDQVSAYMSELQALKEKEDSKMIDLRYRMASALVYKSSNRLLHKFKAADIFEQISSEKIIEHDFTVSATLNLCDLLLLELRLSGNEKALDEVKELAKRLDAIAKMQNSSSLAAQT